MSETIPGSADICIDAQGLSDMIDKAAMLGKLRSLIKSNSILFSITKIILMMLRPIILRAKTARKKLFGLIDRGVDSKKLMINIGGGHYFRRHWRVMDFPSNWYRFLNGTIDYKFDLTNPAPFPLEDNSVSFFYSSHTLEHIPQRYCQYIFDEIYRCLKLGGAVRLTMPDFDLAYEAFKMRREDFFVGNKGQSLCEKFLDYFASYMKSKISNLEIEGNFRNMNKEEFAEYYIRQIPLESQRVAAGNHINWWNYDKLVMYLKTAGFIKIYSSKEQGSRFSEMRGRGWDNGFDSTHPEISLFVEAVK